MTAYVICFKQYKLSVTITIIFSARLVDISSILSNAIASIHKNIQMVLPFITFS